MQAVIYTSADHAELERLAGCYRLGMPFVGRDGSRIGTVIKVWRVGNLLMADIECVPEDMNEKV